MSVALPRHIKIGALKFAVLRHKKILGGKTWGASHYCKATIKVKGGIPVQHQAVTLMHETLHATLTYIDRNDLSDDEKFVERLSESIMDTLWKSPGLMRYFNEANR